MTPLVVVIWGADEAGLALVDALARLHLSVHRGGGSIEVHNASDQVVSMLELSGLSDVLPCDAASAVEVWRQPEALEELGVQKVVDVRDAPA